jgi:hypothetical protein
MLTDIQDKIQDYLIPWAQAFQHLVDIAGNHPILCFEVVAAASVYLLSRDSSAI